MENSTLPPDGYAPLDVRSAYTAQKRLLQRDDARYCRKHREKIRAPARGRATGGDAAVAAPRRYRLYLRDGFFAGHAIRDFSSTIFARRGCC